MGTDEGLPEVSVINCDNLFTVPKRDFEDEPVGRLALDKKVALDRALRYALDIQY